MNNVTRTKRTAIAFVLMLGFAPLASADPSNAFTSGWSPFNQMDNQIFPAKVLAEAMLNLPKNGADQHVQGVTLHMVGDANSAIGIAIGRDEDNARIHLELKLGNLAETTTYDGILKKGGEGYAIFPQILWNYDVLERQRSPTTINAEFSVSINGAAPEKKVQTYRVRSINDLPFAILKSDGSIEQLPWMWGAFVNENHPWIDDLLRAALNTGAVNRFVGYQGSPNEVVNQVYAIWNALQHRGVTYSNITTPSGQSQKVYSQHVRFFEDSITTSQANCVDGTVMFASVLRKIGIDPMLVLLPGHMLLGYWLDEQHTRINYLETTMIGSINLNSFAADGSIAAIGRYSQSQVSLATYNDALREGSNKIARSRIQFQRDDPNYEMIDLAQVREMGIQPINH